MIDIVDCSIDSHSGRQSTYLMIESEKVGEEAFHISDVPKYRIERHADPDLVNDPSIL